MRAVVDDSAGTLARARLGEIDPDPAAAADDVVRANAFRAQRANRRVPDGMGRQPRHVVALEPEVREARCHVRLAAAERCRQDGRLQQPLEPGRAEAQHDLAERHGACRHTYLAAATLETIRRALFVRTSSRPSSIALWSSRADPTPTAIAPARIQSPALSSDTPPVGINRTCGSGALTSLMNCGPRAVAGKTFTMSAPRS